MLCHSYVDDIICLFNSESDADKYFLFRNQQPANIKLTIQKQTHKNSSKQTQTLFSV